MNSKYSLMIISLTLLTLASMLLPISFEKDGIAQGQDKSPAEVLRISRIGIPIDFPMQKGYENGNEIFFIPTDASDKKVAEQITKLVGLKVNYAPLLLHTPESTRSQAYAFINGIPGKGAFGFQIPVLGAKPGDSGYSPLLEINTVAWKNDSSPKELKSVGEVKSAEQRGRLTINKTGIVVNHPAIKWQGGEMKIRDDKSITDESPYGPQVLNIDIDKMVVTMIAHRGFGPGGETIYYLATDASPNLAAQMLGVTSVPSNENLTSTPAAVDLYQFANGINGTGSLGFQADIGGAGPTDRNYSPMWKISFVEWKNPASAKVLETLDDVMAMQKNQTIDITPGLDGKYVANFPFFGQTTIAEHMAKLS